MSDKPLFHVVLQRRDWDCAIASLASFMGQPYEEVLREAAKRFSVEQGLFAKEMVHVADVFNVKLKRRVRKIDLEEHCGVLSVKFPNGMVHAMLLTNGLIFDPQANGTVWDAETYIQVNKAKLIDLLEEVD